MSTERINHAAKALEEINNADTQLGIDEFGYADLSLGRAQVHATLALVEQQRTANILKLIEDEDPAQVERKLAAMGVDAEKVREDLRAAVGWAS